MTNDLIPLEREKKKKWCLLSEALETRSTLTALTARQQKWIIFNPQINKVPT